MDIIKYLSKYCTTILFILLSTGCSYHHFASNNNAQFQYLSKTFNRPITSKSHNLPLHQKTANKLSKQPIQHLAKTTNKPIVHQVNLPKHHHKNIVKIASLTTAQSSKPSKPKTKIAHNIMNKTSKDFHHRDIVILSAKPTASLANTNIANKNNKVHHKTLHLASINKLFDFKGMKNEQNQWKGHPNFGYHSVLVNNSYSNVLEQTEQSVSNHLSNTTHAINRHKTHNESFVYTINLPIQLNTMKTAEIKQLNSLNVMTGGHYFDYAMNYFSRLINLHPVIGLSHYNNIQTLSDSWWQNQWLSSASYLIPASALGYDSNISQPHLYWAVLLLICVLFIGILLLVKILH